jgi:hypothetical protein
MLSVGVAIRLGRRPAEVLRWPLEEVALVAAYCEMEAQGPKKPTAPASAPATRGAQTVTETVTWVVGKQQKKKG